MVIRLAQTLLTWATFWPLRVIKRYNFADWLWGRPLALIQRRHVSSVRKGLANGAKWTPSQNWMNLLSELHVPHKQYFGISDTFSSSFTSIWPSFPRFHCNPNKACLLCANPQALTECSPLDFRRSSIARCKGEENYGWVILFIRTYICSVQDQMAVSATNFDSYTESNISYFTSYTRACDVNQYGVTSNKKHAAIQKQCFLLTIKSSFLKVTMRILQSL